MELFLKIEVGLEEQFMNYYKEDIISNFMEKKESQTKQEILLLLNLKEEEIQITEYIAKNTLMSIYQMKKSSYDYCVQ